MYITQKSHSEGDRLKRKYANVHIFDSFILFNSFYLHLLAYTVLFV